MFDPFTSFFISVSLFFDIIVFCVYLVGGPCFYVSLNYHIRFAIISLRKKEWLLCLNSFHDDL